MWVFFIVILIISSIVYILNRASVKQEKKKQGEVQAEVQELLARPPIIEEHAGKRHLRIWNRKAGTCYVVWEDTHDRRGRHDGWKAGGLHASPRQETVIPVDREKNAKDISIDALIWHWIYNYYSREIANKFKLEVSKRMYHD